MQQLIDRSVKIENVQDAGPADGREFRKWRVPVLLQFALETVERFST